MMHRTRPHTAIQPLFKALATVCVLVLAGCKPASTSTDQQLAGIASPIDAAKPANPVQSAAPAQATVADSAATPPKPFDPATCKGGEKGHVYWAARDQVFKFRFDPSIPLYPRLNRVLDSGETLEEIKEIPPAPDPTAPQGCFGNPLRGEAVPYMKEFSERLHLSVFGRSKMTVTRHVNSFYSGLTEGLVRIAEFDKRQNLMKDLPFCGQRPSGIHECLTANNKNFDDYSSGRLILIGRELISKKSDVPDITFYLYTPYFPKKSIDGITMDMGGDFLLVNSVYIHEAFVIWSNQIDLLIPYYSKLNEYITSAHVPHYTWTPTKPKAKPK